MASALKGQYNYNYSPVGLYKHTSLSQSGKATAFSIYNTTGNMKGGKTP